MRLFLPLLMAHLEEWQEELELFAISFKHSSMLRKLDYALTLAGRSLWANYRWPHILVDLC